MELGLGQLGAHRPQERPHRAPLRQRRGRAPAVLPGVAIAFGRAGPSFGRRRKIIVPQKSEGVPPAAPLGLHPRDQRNPGRAAAQAQGAGQRNRAICLSDHGLDLGPPRLRRRRPGAMLARIVIARRRTRPPPRRKIIVRRNRRFRSVSGPQVRTVRSMFHGRISTGTTLACQAGDCQVRSIEIRRRPSNLDIGEQIHIGMVQKNSVSRVSGRFSEKTAPAEFSDQRIGVGKADA
jgi:hypothetical protein